MEEKEPKTEPKFKIECWHCGFRYSPSRYACPRCTIKNEDSKINKDGTRR